MFDLFNFNKNKQYLIIMTFLSSFLFTIPNLNSGFCKKNNRPIPNLNSGFCKKNNRLLSTFYISNHPFFPEKVINFIKTLGCAKRCLSYIFC